MKANFCFDFVILVADHDASVRKYETLLGIEPIELDPASLPTPNTRCTVFPLWNEGDRGMVLSLVTPGDADSVQGRQLARRGEGLALFGIDVDDVEARASSGWTRHPRPTTTGAWCSHARARPTTFRSSSRPIGRAGGRRPSPAGRAEETTSCGRARSSCATAAPAARVGRSAERPRGRARPT